MTALNSFQRDLTVAVVGASGSIGAEFVRQLAADERVVNIFALSRTPDEFSLGDMRYALGGGLRVNFPFLGSPLPIGSPIRSGIAPANAASAGDSCSSS